VSALDHLLVTQDDDCAGRRAVGKSLVDTGD
jgi:hypothetical protein